MAWRISHRLLRIAVVVWLLVVIGANVPGAGDVIGLLFGTGRIADVVGASLAGAMLICSVIIWVGAIAHLRRNMTLTDGPRVAWTIVVYGFFVFGALVYYFTQMRGDDLAAA